MPAAKRGSVARHCARSYSHVKHGSSLEFRFDPAGHCLAFLITFSALLGVGLLWMGLFMWFGEADSATLNAIADWLSPQSLSGWIFYILLSSACFLPFRRYLNKGSDMRDDSHDSE